MRGMREKRERVVNTQQSRVTGEKEKSGGFKRK